MHGLKAGRDMDDPGFDRDHVYPNIGYLPRQIRHFLAGKCNTNRFHTGVRRGEPVVISRAVAGPVASPVKGQGGDDRYVHILCTGRDPMADWFGDMECALNQGWKGLQGTRAGGGEPMAKLPGVYQQRCFQGNIQKMQGLK